MAEDQHNHSKLHSIYAALDTHNYTRALKLSQHKSISTWKITLALRCHILRRIGRKEECVSLLKKQILGYIKVDDPKHDEVSALLLYLRRQKNQLNNNNGAGKNQLVSGKNDGGSSIGLLEEKDALKRLDFPLTKTIMNAELDANGGEVITDETTLATIALTLNSFQLNQTLIQMYSLAVANNPSLHFDLYFSNLRLLMDPKYDNNASTNILFENMQTSAMYLARSDIKCFMWTAKTALWRLEEIRRMEKENGTDEQGENDNSKIKAMLPRLAESLANKVVGQRHLASVDDWKVYVQSLISQEKYTEAIDALLEYNPPSVSEREGTDVPPYLTAKGKMELLASLAVKAGDYERGVQWYQHLLKDFTDDWSYGSSMLRCAYESEKEKECSEILDELQNETSSEKPIRGPHLLAIEMVALRLKKLNEDQSTAADNECHKLQQKIIHYVAIFGGTAACCFSDIRPYLTLLLEKASNKESVITELLDHFVDIQRKEKIQGDSNQTRTHSYYSTEKRKLRRYIIACQICLKVWSMATETCGMILDKKLLPNVDDMLKQWELSFISYNEFASGDGSQKEVLPGDDLILLSAFTILTHHKDDQNNPDLIMNVIAILEHGLEKSPYNPQLILFLLSLYSTPQTLNASSRSLSLFQSLDIKQIQLDSLSYLFLPFSLTSGLYTEAARHCGNILGIHRHSATDVPNYAKKSMINGFYPVVEDMLNFQRFKMQRSVQLLEAKGLIMDFAPLALENANTDICLGYINGLVGGLDDESRAMAMVDNADDFFGAPSIIKICGNYKSVPNIVNAEYADNRDFSVWNFIIGSADKYGVNSQWISSKKMIKDSLERGHIHGILVRAVLIIHAAKPIKKKKKKKKETISEIVQERCKSMTVAVQNAVAASGNSRRFWAITQLFCTIITSLCANDPPIVVDENDKESNTITTLLKKTLDEMTEFRTECTSMIMNASSTNLTAKTASALCAICTDLPNRIVPIFALLESIRKLFKLQGRTKNKEQTKKEAEMLVQLGSDFIALIRDYKNALTGDTFASITSELLIKNVTEFSKSSPILNHIDFLDSPDGKNKVHETVQNIIGSRATSTDNVLPFLNHMINAIDKNEL